MFKNLWQKLKNWKPIHLCWFFEKHGWKIPKYLIGQSSSSSSSSSSSFSSSSSSSSSCTVAQPQAGDYLNSPDHATLHRVIATDLTAPVKTIAITPAGDVGVGTCEPKAKLDVKGSGSDIFNLHDSSGNEKVTVLENGNVGIGTATPEGALGIKDANTYIDKDGSNNMTFTDAIVGTKTLKQLGSPTYVFIKATTQSEGDLHLLDGSNWAVSKALIKVVRIVTSSTDWDLYVLQNDNGYAANDANIPRIQIMEAGNGNADIYLDLPYEDEDATSEVHLYFLDNSGTNTADIYIIGLEMI